jgi:hypothetical protein
MDSRELRLRRCAWVGDAEVSAFETVRSLEERLALLREMRRGLLEVHRCWLLFDAAPGFSSPLALGLSIRRCEECIVYCESRLQCARGELLDVNFSDGLI